MQISADKVVSVHYKLVVDGETIDQSTDEPLTYLHGHNSMIPGFERELEKLKTDDTFDFVVTSADGYGERDEAAVNDLDIGIFQSDGKVSDQVHPGAQLQMRNQDGNPIIGTVLSIEEKTVKMDFNHVLAGKTLNFSGNVHEVREASKEELEHGHAHGPDGHHH
jgi:FKBP-type peptidyl-prolyl cis-trans isomerase SlyD